MTEKGMCQKLPPLYPATVAIGTPEIKLINDYYFHMGRLKTTIY
jgi:hypothetical protein